MTTKEKIEELKKRFSVEQMKKEICYRVREVIETLKEDQGLFDPEDIARYIHDVVEVYCESQTKDIDEDLGVGKIFCDYQIGVNAWGETYFDDGEFIQFEIDEETHNAISETIRSNLKECVSLVESSKNLFDLFNFDEEIYWKYCVIDKRKPEIDKTKKEICIDGKDEDSLMSDEAYELCVDFIKTVDWSFLLPRVEEMKKSYSKIIVAAKFSAFDFCIRDFPYPSYYDKLAPLFKGYVNGRNVCFTKTEKNKWTKKLEKVLVHIRDVFGKLEELDNEIAFELLKASNVSEEVLDEAKKKLHIKY